MKPAFIWMEFVLVRFFGRLICVLALVAPLTAGAQRFGDILVDVDDTEVGTPIALHGYRSLSVVVQNFGEQPRDVTLVLDNADSQWEYLNLVERKLHLAGKARLRITLPLEIRANFPAKMTVVIDGEAQQEGVDLPRGYGLRSLRANVLSDRPINLAKDFDDFYSDIPVDWTIPNNHPRNGESVLNYVKNILDWTDQWLDYSSYEQIWIELANWNQLEQAQKEAINAWVRHGGHLVVYGGTQNLLNFWDGPVSKIGDSVYTSSVVFGFVSVCPAYSELNGQERNYFIDDLKKAFMPWVADSNYAPNELGVHLESDIHLRGFIVLLLIFACLLGPINIYILFRRNKRMWLYATVPAFSVLASLGIFAFSYFYYGSENHVQRYALVFLDQTQKRANILGYDALLPMTSYSKGLSFPLNAEVDPLIEDRSPHWRSLTIEEDQRFRKGWLPARTLSQFRFRFEETRRERLLFEREGDALYATNHLGAEVERFLYHGLDGQHFAAPKLPVGKRVKLEPLELGTQARNPRHLYTTVWFGRDFFREVDLVGQHGLQAKGSYLAVMNATPFSPQTIASADLVSQKTILIGQGGAL